MAITNLILTADASGAAMAGSLGMVVVVVDIIDFSTSMEAVIDAGAAAIFGASPDSARPPVKTDPFKIGELAGREALGLGTVVIVLAEPRAGEENNRRSGASRALNGVISTGAEVIAVLPNLGAESASLADITGKVVLGSTGSGGVAFDAAVTAGSPAVLTGTVARTLKKNGISSARRSALAAVTKARQLGAGIAVVAASGSAVEDLLAAEYIYKAILEILRGEKTS